jgi:maltooligosyltrehalose trehalohydrolase
MANMSSLRIWAPDAKQVDIISRARGTVPAHPSDDGWWTGPALEDGDEYSISLDGGDPRPDPRSRWQPSGVHGPSRWMEPAHRAPPPAAFRAVPLHEAVIYELHVGTFSKAGSFQGVVEHLEHLVHIGITHVELMPVAQFSGRHGWGYDGVDLFAPHEPYGGPAGLRALIEACHQRQLAVLIDVVHNHFGPEGSYLTQFGPYKTSRHHTPWGEAINLDGPRAAEVRRFLLDSALMWLRDYGADGLRLDAIHALRDDSARHFVAELTDEVRALERILGRPLVLVGEYDDHDPRSVTSRALGGWGLDAHWNDDFHHAAHALLTGETSGYYGDFAAPQCLPKVLEQGYALDGGYSAFREARHGKPFGDLPRDRLVGYIQSHDQVGNRAGGERLHQLCGLPRAKIAAALLFCSPFVPMIFQGEEWAASTPFFYFAELESEQLRRAVREGRRAEHAGAGWETAPDPTDPATRERSTLAWQEIVREPHAEMLRWYRDLIALRRATPGLRSAAAGATSVELLHAGGLRIDRGTHALLINLSNAPIPCGGFVELASAKLRAGQLPPEACAIIRA